MPTHRHIKLGQVWLKRDACPVVAGLAGCDLGCALGAHVVAERLQEAALALAVTRLYCELRTEDVGQLGAVTVAPTSDLLNGSRAVHFHNLAYHAVVRVCYATAE